MEWTALAAFCGSKVVSAGNLLGNEASLPVLLFFVALGGSVVHCGPMCGPFVLAQVSDRLAAVPASRLCETTRMTSALLLPYHLGRLTTYAGLGVAGASAGALLGSLPWFGDLSAILLFGAASLFLAQSLKRLVPLPKMSVPWLSSVARKAASLDRTRWSGSFALGLMLGLLPCGLVYGALVAASASGRVLPGALAMMGFGLGTVPSLVTIGLMGHMTGSRWRGLQARIAPVLMLSCALALAAIGMARLIA